MSRFTKIEIPSGDKNGSNLEFILSKEPVPGSLVLYYNGQVLIESIDFSLSDQIVTVIIPPESYDNLIAQYDWNDTVPSFSNYTIGQINQKTSYHKQEEIIVHYAGPSGVNITIDLLDNQDNTDLFINRNMSEVRTNLYEFRYSVPQKGIYTFICRNNGEEIVHALQVDVGPGESTSSVGLPKLELI